MRNVDFPTHPFPSARGSWRASSLLWLWIGFLAGCAFLAQAQSNFFDDTNLVRISITIPAAGIRTLRTYHWDAQNPNATHRPFAPALVQIDDKFYTNVAIHLKGSFGTFRSIDNWPSLTLNFDKLIPGQSFSGLTKISLNNALQDPTCLHEKLARELFDAAGVPVPRADFAVVILNGRRLGLYVATEAFGKSFLKRYFKPVDGNLYEAGYLSDIDRLQAMRLAVGNRPDGMTAMQRMLAATQLPDSKQRFTQLEKVLNLGCFLSMMAMETILCHWDGYSMNRNNYRVYYEPATGKLTFMPHGMDQILGIDRPNLNLPLVPTMTGKVSRALLSTSEGRRLYLERMRSLASNLFDAERLCQHIREIDRKIAGEFQADKRWPIRGSGQRAFIMSFGDHSQDVDDLCQRISAREQNLKSQLQRLESTAFGAEK